MKTSTATAAAGDADVSEVAAANLIKLYADIEVRQSLLSMP